MKGNALQQEKLNRRHGKIRARISGTAARPRLSVYKSNRFLEAQLINDDTSTTILSGNTRAFLAKKGTKRDAAVMLGEDIAKRAKDAGVTTIVFDRGGFRFTGRVAALAEAARKGGLIF